MKKLIAIAGAAIALLIVTGCENDATIANKNLTTAADNFEVERRIVFVNGITDKYILEVVGRCSITDEVHQLEVLCKTGPSEFKKHFLGRSDNMTYFAEQIGTVQASAYNYRVTFKPQSIIPSIDLRTSLDQE